LSSAPRTLLHHSGQIASRVRDRLSGAPVVAVLAGRGDSDNFGDEWMFEVLAKGLSDCRLVEIGHPATERRLRRMRLSGAHLFSAVVVGGGTLMNAYFLPRLVPFMAEGLPAWSVGTGVGSAGFGVRETDADPSGWVDVLPGFERVTVRGPLSRDRLGELGFGAAEVIGDLALAETPQSPLVSWESRRLVVNVAGSEKETAERGEALPESEVVEAVAGPLGTLSEQGWEIVPFALHDDDLPRLAALGTRLGGWREAPVRVREWADVERLLRGARALLGLKLHAATLGWMCGVPTLGLAYRSKTLDLAGFLGAEDQVVDLRTAATGDLASAVQELTTRPPEAIDEPHRRALAAKRDLGALMAEINAMASARR
jgi:polysaccharide pyruvyl transferase WcaK-like protein